MKDLINPDFNNLLINIYWVKEINMDRITLSEYIRKISSVLGEIETEDIRIAAVFNSIAQTWKALGEDPQKFIASGAAAIKRFLDNKVADIGEITEALKKATNDSVYLTTDLKLALK